MKRYDCEPASGYNAGGEMIERDDGEWVRHEEAKAERDALRDEVEKLTCVLQADMADTRSEASEFIVNQNIGILQARVKAWERFAASIAETIKLAERQPQEEDSYQYLLMLLKREFVPAASEKGADLHYEGHRSDCAVHNEPAEPAGPCNCGMLTPKGGDDASG